MPMNADHALRNLESHFNRLLSEVVVFKSLYSNREAFELIGSHLHDLFANIQRPLIDSIVLCICRMLDPAETCGNKNITFYYLARIIPRDQAALLSKLNTLKAEISPLRELRNKIVGHSDLLAHTNDVIKYTGASHDEIFETLPKITDILNFCSTIVRGSEIPYQVIDLSDGGPDALVNILRGIR